MASKKPETIEVAEQVRTSANAFLERLLSSHERFSEALSTARARNARVADKFFEIVLAGQRDAIELGKSMTTDPSAYSKNMEAIMHSMTAAQERALELAKTVYREQSEAAADARTIAERAIATTKTIGQPFETFTTLWSPAAK